MRIRPARRDCSILMRLAPSRYGNLAAQLLNGTFFVTAAASRSTAGDSIVAACPSSINAAKCALDVQAPIADAHEDIPRERQVILRIGIHVGEIMIKSGDLFGDGVNIAARIEKLGPPGCVAVSEVAF